MTFSLSNKHMQRMGRLALVAAVLALCALSTGSADARPVAKGKKTGKEPENFLRQHNTYSNISFYYTNRGVLFNNDAVAGLIWPRGSSNTYVFGGGLWFATQKEIQGRRHKLCELGYNPNSGAGWYLEGEANEAAINDPMSPAAKYISYVSPLYDKTSGKPISGSGPNWPLWDTSLTKTFKHNFYFGDYISKTTDRGTLKKGNSTATPAIISEEDIVNLYSDAVDPVHSNPEYKPNGGYPFGLDIQEVIYSWSFGRYRDMIFLRHKVTNQSNETLFNCYVAPAFDPDLATPQNDHNSFVTDTVGLADARLAGLREPYVSHPSLLNMGYQWSNPENGKEYGMVGFSFLESPVVDPSTGDIIANDDSAGLHGYGPNSLFQKNQLGLTTFKKWTIDNDPSTGDLRYDFVSSGTKDLDNGITGDMRLLFATGPFTLKPGKSVETTVAIAIANVSPTNKAKNFQALLSQIDFAHLVFGEPNLVPFDNAGTPDTGYVLNHFLSPVPPAVPNMRTQALDRAVLVSWDSTAERSTDTVSSYYDPAINGPHSLPFVGYQLWRTTRSDRDSTIRPDGINPNVMLGQWQLYDYRTDSVFGSNGRLTGFRYVRLNSTPNAIPHSYLDFGDDDHNGVLTGSEGLKNGVKYYYYLIAYDEYDSINKVGPLYTSVVPPKNFVSEIPTKPPYIQHVDSSRNQAINIVGNCQSGGVKSIRLDIVDTGRFLQRYANDTIRVSFQPMWGTQASPGGEYITAGIPYMRLYELVNVSDSRGLNNTYFNLQKPSDNPASYGYYLWTGIQGHVPGTVSADSAIVGQFTTDRPDFQPNQLVDQSFRVLVDYQFNQLNTPYRLRSVSVQGSGDPNILRLSRRTNMGKADQSIYNLKDTGYYTRPSLLGSLGESTYEVSFGQQEDSPIGIQINTTTIHPPVLPVTVKLVSECGTVLKHVTDPANQQVPEFDDIYYTDVQQGYPRFDDPDTMMVPLPGLWAMDAFHWTDEAAYDQPHTGATELYTTTGPYYWPLTPNGNVVDGLTHLVVHRLRLGGGEFIFNAPGIPSSSFTGDTLTDNGPYTNDFKPGDKITIAFSGIGRNLPAPNADFYIVTPSGSDVQFANANNYNESVLSQVQVVPNPYIVTHEGQTSTDNAKLYFTRLPPRATIEIYALDGTLVKTIEHNGYAPTGQIGINGEVATNNTSVLADRYSLEEWNLLTEGKQRVGSQVLIARVIAKDPQSGAEIAETTTKFAVIVGGTRQLQNQTQ